MFNSRAAHCFLLIALFVAPSAYSAIYEVPSNPNQEWGSANYSAYASGQGLPSTIYQAGSMSCSHCDAGSGGNAPWTSPPSADIWFDQTPAPATSPAFQCYNKNDAPNGNACTVRITKCAANESFNIDTGNCSNAPPVCTEAGHKVYTFTVGGVTTSWCSRDFDETGDDCEDVAGTFNGDVICNDSKNECESSGGTYGYVNGQQTCLSGDYDDDLPTCRGIETVQVIDGGFACISPVEENPDNDVPDQEDPKPDNDNDGIPDDEDPDDDNDGIPDDIDDDDDNDGIPDPNDPTPSGEGEDQKNEVRGGGNCGASPICTGDAVQCANLYQLWKIRCATDDDSVTNANDCDTASDCVGDPVECAIFLQQKATRCESPGIEDQDELDALTTGLEAESVMSDVDLQSDLANIYNAGSPGGSCPSDVSLSLSSGATQVSFQPLCDMATSMRPLVLIAFSLAAFVAVYRSF